MSRWCNSGATSGATFSPFAETRRTRIVRQNAYYLVRFMREKDGPLIQRPSLKKAGPLLDSSSDPDAIITRKQLLRRLKTITDKKFGELLARGLIPEIDLGHRTKRYRESAVRKALIQLESEVSE